MRKITLSFGGNALGITHQEQIRNAKFAAKFIVDISETANVIVITGNGPISGNISLGLDYAANKNITKSTYSLANIVAMTQGSISSDFEIAILNELAQRNITKSVTSLLTHVVVDKNDPKFLKPSKPIGTFYRQVDADILAKQNRWTMKEDAGRGYRRVVASPMPISIVEEAKIHSLTSIPDSITICGVGGGIPVIKNKNTFELVDAVIDKDFTSAYLAKVTNSEKLVILTAAKGVALNYGKKNEKWLDNITVLEMKKLISENYFPDGSMGPKVKAAVKYVEETNNVAIIAALEDATGANKLSGGTVIRK